MKKLFTILLSFFVLAGSTSDLAIVFSFKINQTFIANNWCINKLKPKNTCQGKCYLKKQLEENKNTDDQPTPQLAEKRITFICIETSPPEVTSSTTSSHQRFSYAIYRSHQYIFEIDPPPKVFLS